MTDTNVLIFCFIEEEDLKFAVKRVILMKNEIYVFCDSVFRFAVHMCCAYPRSTKSFKR